MLFLIKIVSSAQRVVAQNLIGVLQIAKPFGGVRVVGIGVRMRGKTQPAISLLDFMLICLWPNPKEFIIILIVWDQIQNAGKKLESLPEKLGGDLELSATLDDPPITVGIGIEQVMGQAPCLLQHRGFRNNPQHKLVRVRFRGKKVDKPLERITNHVA